MATITSGGLARARTRPTARVASALRRVPWIPLLLLSPLVVFGLFGLQLAPHNPFDIDLEHRLAPPFWVAGGTPAHLLGTDTLGRDLLSRIMIGARATLLVCVVGVALAGLIGVALGMVAGFAGGVVDEVLMRITDIQLAMLPVLLAVLIAGALHGGLQAIIATIAISFWAAYARLVRAETMSLVHRDFVALAVVAGCSRTRILVRHILPNLAGTIIVMATLQVGAAVGVESALTFLGLGVQPPNSAWGLLISEGRIFMSTAWWVPTFPGLCIAVTVLGANLLGDWFRDRLDPRLRNSA